MLIDVNLLWCYGELTDLARLSLAAYYRNGCRPIIWTYDWMKQVDAVFKTGGHARVEDARAIMPESEIERYICNGQMTLFSDRFAWEVSHRFGGWVGHLDFTLLKPIDQLDQLPYVFGPHHRCATGMPLWKAPVGSPAVSAMLTTKVQMPPLHWYAMMDVQSDQVRAHGLEGYVLRDLHNDDSDEVIVRNLLLEGSTLPLHWDRLYGIHWMGSGTIRGRKIEKGSYFHQLQERYEVLGR